MAKRGRKKKFKVSFNISPETYRSILAIVLFVFSAIALISFIAPDYLINSKIQLIFRKMFGLSSLLLPVITAIIGLLFIDAIKARIKELRVVVGLALLLLSLSGIFHIFIANENAKEYALNGRGGGFVGYLISSALESTISIYGGVLLLVATVVASVILIFNISLDQILIFVKEKLNFKSVSKDNNKSKDEIVITGADGVEIDRTSGDDIENTGIEDEAIKMDQNHFEIVPTMYEPQSGLSVEAALSKNSNEITTISPITNMPPKDRVWRLPPLDLLEDESTEPTETGDMVDNQKKIVDTLKSFGIDVEVVNYQIGPTFTKYELRAPLGIRIAKISNLQYDLALALSSPSGSVRIESPIPGKSLIGIEVPNKIRAVVNFKSLISSDAMKANKSKLAIVLGKDVGGVGQIYDVGKMPHALIAGATGSGKSVFIHNLILSILYRATPEEVKFIMVDPKRVELKAYEGVPHLYTPIVTDTEKTPAVFKWAVTEMQRRYKLFESAKVKTIDEYNNRSGFQAMPYILLIVDELAEVLMADPNIDKSIIRLGQLARATGMHLILATQRPSADIITGLIKANIPCRIAFSVTSQVNSKVIMDMSGAEKLMGKGDMLFLPQEKPNPLRLQSANISTQEISNVVNFLKNQGPPDYKEEILETPSDADTSKSVAAGGETVDENYEKALEIVVSAGKASASLLQRRLSIGYARAARILDELHEKGVVGPANGSRPRDVLLDSIPFPEDPSIGDIVNPSTNSPDL